MSVSIDLSRPMPSCPDAEQAILSAVLMKPERLSIVLHELTPSDFYLPEHQAVFQTMVDLSRAGKSVDLITLAEGLRVAGKLEEVGGSVYLAQLSIGIGGNVQEHIRLVKERAFRRNVMLAGLKAVEQAQDLTRDPFATTRQLSASLGGKEAAEADSVSWKLSRELFPRIPFPWEIFPPALATSLKQMARACATSATSLPGLAICLMASALGRMLEVAPKVSWVEPLVFWICDIRNSGAGKTAPMWELARELTKRQASEHERFKADQDEWDSASPKDRQRMTPPRQPRGYFSTNLTLEGLHSDLDGHQTGGMAVLLNEISALISGQNQYRAKGGTDREGWLSLHDGKPARVVRSRGSVYIHGARIQVCGGIQPSLFRQVFGSEGGQYIEDGTVFRCLFTFEPSMHHELTAESWAEEHRDAWAATLGRAFDWAERQQESNLLILSPEAQTRFFDWRNNLDVQRLDLPHNFQGFLPKAYGYTLRLAGALHALERFATGREPGKILSLMEMERAILAVHFYLGQAVDALRLLVGDKEPVAPMDVSPRTVLLARVLDDLRGQMDNGRLAVGFIQESYNLAAKPEERVNSPRAMGALLRSCGLNVSSGLHDANGRKRAHCLVWDDKACSFAKQSLVCLGSLESNGSCGVPARDVGYANFVEVSHAPETCETLGIQCLESVSRPNSGSGCFRDKRDVSEQEMWDSPAEVAI